MQKTIFECILLLILGMYFLIKGADLFVEGSSNVARKLKIPALIIGLTLVSIGTSAPELSVSLTSAIQGKEDLSLANVVGSNIFNVLVVIGASSLFIPITVSKSVYKLDIPILLGIYLLVTLFAMVISPGELVLWESIILLSITVIYILFLIIRGKKENQGKPEEVLSEEETKKINCWWKNILFIALGLAGVVFGGDIVVNNASAIATSLSMSEDLVGLTIVAVGTSLPELVTSMVAAKKGENDIAVGNAIGSCIFNMVLILGLSSTINPLSGLTINEYIDLFVMIGSVVLVALLAIKSFKINRIEGIVMITLYFVYLAFIILRDYNIISLA